MAEVVLNQEQGRIIEFIRGIQTPRGKKWNKYRGDIANRFIIDCMKSHITNYEILGPAAYVVNFPTEFDILIVRQGARPLEHSNAYAKVDVRLIIEIKKHGLYYKKGEAVKEIGDYIQQFENTGIKWLYLTIAESVTMWNATREVMGDRGFCLSISPKMVEITGEWSKFIHKVQSELL